MAWFNFYDKSDKIDLVEIENWTVAIRGLVVCVCGGVKWEVSEG